MVAYSFQPMFVEPIRKGLESDLHPRKRQTIRAERKRHALPGEELQLYCRQRHPSGFLIGRAKCVGTASIAIVFGRSKRDDSIFVGDGLFLSEYSSTGMKGKFTRTADLDEFARCDGFENWAALRDFWRRHHGVRRFSGRIILWEPLS